MEQCTHLVAHVFLLCLRVWCTCDFGSLASSIREISCWQAERGSVPGPLTVLCLLECWNVPECGARTGGEVPGRDSHPRQKPPPHPPPLPSCFFPLVFPGSQETSIFFSLLAGEEEGRQTGETGWFNMRLSPDISFYFPPLGNFLPPSDKLSLDTIVPTHGEIFPILLQVHYLMVLGEGKKKSNLSLRPHWCFQSTSPNSKTAIPL